MSNSKPANYTTIQIGDVFTRWTVVGLPFQQTKATDGANEWFVPCRCVCGFTRAVRVAQLFNHHSRSCGCLKNEPECLHGESGRARTHLYRVWYAMKSRCYNVKHRMFPHYGGRGILVCKEWRESFISFRDWANANGYSPDLQIDRIDNDGSYEPGNCRWVTEHQNKRNTSQTHFVTAFGETKCLTDWAHDPRCAVTYTGLAARLKRGVDPEQAISMPPQPRTDRRWHCHGVND